MFKLDFAEAEQLQEKMKAYEGNTEEAINEVLHNYAGDRAQVEIFKLMPVSNKEKGGHANTANSLRNVLGNLSVTATTKGKYGYLYFPDDGTSTVRHVGNQRFFERGGEQAMDDIIERCVTRLTNEF